MNNMKFCAQIGTLILSVLPWKKTARQKRVIQTMFLVTLHSENVFTLHNTSYIALYYNLC